MTASETPLMRELVKWAYRSCPEIVEKWHVTAGSGLEACINRSIQDFEDMDALKFYVVTSGKDTVGYFGSQYQGRYQPTIFIHPKYRARKKEFWNVIQAKMQPKWSGGIFTKNIPCYKFYSKMGHEVSRGKSADGEFAVFSFQRIGG